MKHTQQLPPLPGVMAALGKTFDDVYDLRFGEVKQITTQEGIYLKRGDVVLVRSTSVPELGDHYIVVTGRPVMKDHGMRPQTMSFPAMQNSPLLDMFDHAGDHVVLLKLDNKASQAFLNHYGLHLDIACNIVIDNPEIVEEA